MLISIENTRETRVGFGKDPVKNLIWLTQNGNSIKLSKTGVENLVKALQDELKQWGND